MLSYKLNSMGFDVGKIQAMALDVVTGISAAGSTQSTATHLDAASNFVSTVSSGQGVRLSINAIGGDEQFVFNGGSVALKVYPPVGAAINGLSTNLPAILAAETGCVFYCGSTTQWAAVLSA